MTAADVPLLHSCENPAPAPCLPRFEIRTCGHLVYDGRQDMPGDIYYTVENMLLGVGEMEAFLVDVLAGERPTVALFRFRPLCTNLDP